MQEGKFILLQGFEISITAALETLESLHEQVGLGFGNIKRACSPEGHFNSEFIEKFQFASYELAFCEAEISAANCLLESTQETDINSIDFSLSIFFAGEMFKSVTARLRSIHVDAEIDLRTLANIEASDSAKGLLISCNGALVAEIGDKIARDEIKRLASGLNEEKELVRETFYRFANDLVAPLAEEIHREDKDIPEEIIKPAAELGCFGICIPERFGGLQPDDKADSLGMIVVTEELSRGSLGAAGSLITRPEIAARALLAGGTESQQNRWLPLLASGEMLCAISILSLIHI